MPARACERRGLVSDGRRRRRATGSRPTRRAAPAPRAGRSGSCWPASTSTCSATSDRDAILDSRARRQGRAGRQRHLPADHRRRRPHRRHVVADARARDADDHAASVRGSRERARREGHAGGRIATATSSACPRRCKPVVAVRRGGGLDSARRRRSLHARPARARSAGARRGGSRRADEVVPLFVLDRALLARFGAPNRVAFLLDSLRDLDASLRDARRCALRARGRRRRARRCASRREARAGAIFVSEDVSAYAQARERRLARGVRRERPGAARHAGRHRVPAGRPRSRRAATATASSRRTGAAGSARRGARSRGHRARSPCPPRLRAGGCLRSAPSPAPESRPTCRAGGESEGGSASTAGSRAGVGRYDAAARRPRRRRHLAAQRRTCISAASRRSRWPSARAAARAPSRSSASSAGATSTRSCSRAPRDRRRRTSARAAIAGARTTPGSRPGRRAARASRSSTPACASSRARASCTTARGC